MARVSLHYEHTQLRKPPEERHVHIPGLNFLHDYFHKKFLWYRNWHHHPLRSHVHWSIFIVATFIILGSITSSLLVPEKTYAATIIWSGGGTVGKCGAGAENDWSCVQNWFGEVVPSSSDLARFDGDATKDSNIDISFAGSVGGIIIASGYTGTITQEIGTFTVGSQDFTQSDGTYTSSGSVTLDVNDVFQVDGGSFVAPAFMEVEGDFVIGASMFDHNNGRVTFDGSDASNSTLNVGTTETFYSIEINKTGSGGPGGNGGISIATNDTVKLISTLRLFDGDLDGATGAIMEAESGVTILSAFNGGGTNEVLAFTSSTTRTITIPAGASMPTLSIDGPNITIATSGTGDITYDSSVDMSTGTYNMGTVTNTFQGKFTLTGGVVNAASSGKIVLDGGYDQQGGTFNSVDGEFDIDTAQALEVSGGTFNGGDYASITTGDVTITGGVLNSASTTLFVVGNWSHTAGTFNHVSGTVQFKGANQIISGTTTFYNFIKTTTMADTFQMATSTTTTVLNQMTVTGNLGAILTFRSTVTGTAANIDPQATSTFEYLVVKDINNVNITTVSCFTECTDSGGNTNWDFSPNSPPIIQSLIITDSPTGTSSLSNLSLIEFSTTSFYITGEFTDVDGCSDVATSGTAKARLFKSPDRFYETCDVATTDQNICYVETATTTCSFSACSGGSDVTSTFNCVMDVYYFASSSDGQQFESWVAAIELADDSGESTSSTTSTQMDQLVALSVSSSFGYGLVALGATSSESGLEIINSGNTTISTRVSGMDMVCSGAGTIPLANQHYSVTPSLDYAFMNPLSSTVATVTLGLGKQLNTSTLSTTTLYWRLLVPSIGLRGTCSGTTTLIGVED